MVLTDRRVYLGFCLLLLGLIWLVYHPTLKHIPRADQWILLLDTIDHYEFFDLVSHSYSYSRTRVIYAGDTQLFRPLFFVFLAAERAAFGNDFRLWHATGVMLHFFAVCLLLRVMLRIHALAFAGSDPPSRWSPFALVPYALVLFFALNFAIVEQVIWFNINGYILFVILVLGSFSLLLESVANPRLTARQHRFRLIGAWALALLAAFTYEMGQFYAVLVGFFLLTNLWHQGRLRRGVGLLAVFLAIALLYQSMNQLDRWVHQDHYQDDVVFSDLTGQLFSSLSLNHWIRYSVFAVVQPFLPFNCKAETHPTGKGIFREQIWNGEVTLDAAMIFSLAVLALWMGLTFAGWARLLAGRKWTWLIVGALALGMAIIHMSLIVFGRLNMRPIPEYLWMNHYYIYLSLLFLLLTSAVVLPLLGSLKGLLSARIVKGCAFVLCGGLLILSVSSGFQTYSINTQTARTFKLQRWVYDSLHAFVQEHRNEKEFSFALKLHQLDGLPSVTGVPCPVILYKRYLDNDHPKYVLWFDNFRLVAMKADEWRRLYPGEQALLCPELVQVGGQFHIFRYQDRFYALSYPAAYVFVYTPNRVNFPGALKDRSLEGLLEQIEVLKHPERTIRTSSPARSSG